MAHRIAEHISLSELISPYDCAINLLPGTTSLRSRIYPLLCTELAEMEEYVPEALKQAYIVSSTSPQSAEFFCIEKKGGLL